jgi:hypothetical protein
MADQSELHSRLTGEIIKGRAVIRSGEGSVFTTFDEAQTCNILRALGRLTGFAART